MRSSPASRLEDTHRKSTIYKSRLHPPLPLAPATMIPDFVASDDIPRKLTWSNPDGPTTPRATGQPFLPHDGTIDPSLLIVENHELSQRNSSSVPLHTSGDGHSQHLAPAFSTSIEVWVVYPGDQPSTSALSPINPPVGNRVSPLKV